MSDTHSRNGEWCWACDEYCKYDDKSYADENRDEYCNLHRQPYNENAPRVSASFTLRASLIRVAARLTVFAMVGNHFL